MKADKEAIKGKAIDLVDFVEYSDDSVVSKTLVDKKVGTVTLFSFDEGQGLGEHTSPYDAVVQVVDGEADLTIGGEVVKASAGELVIMPAGIPHSVRAAKRFKMMLIMIRQAKPEA